MTFDRNAGGKELIELEMFTVKIIKRLPILLICLLVSCYPKRTEDNFQKEAAKESDSIDLEMIELLDVMPQENDTKKKEESKMHFRLDLDKVNSFKCNVNIILHVSVNIDSLSNKDIDALLRTFDTSCSNNLEFVEFSNEMLIKTLEKYPRETLRLLEENHSKYNFSIIFSELSYPIHDGISVKEIEKVILEENFTGSRIDSVLLALEVAGNS